MTAFPPPLRSGGNAALSGRAWFTPPLRCGENQALETDALRATAQRRIRSKKKNKLKFYLLMDII
jgi:hypothetical protein